MNNTQQSPEIIPEQQGQVKRKKTRLEKTHWGYIFIIPFFVTYLIFSAYPMVTTFYYSLTDKSTFGRSDEDGNAEYTLVGLKNFYHREEFDDLELFPDEGKKQSVCKDKSCSNKRLGVECVFVRLEKPDGRPAEIMVRADGSEYLYRRDLVYEIQRDEEGRIFALGYIESGALGIKNYRVAFLNTPLLWVMGFVPQLGLALMLAAWFTNTKFKARGQKFFKVVFYMPNIMTAATIGALYLAFCNPGGLIHQIAVWSGYIAEGEILREIWFTRGSVAAINSWMWFGNSMIVLIAGINGINPSLFEAAHIDGARASKVFWLITVPLIKPILTFTFVQSLVGGFQMFDVPRILSLGVASNLNTEGTRVIMNSIMSVAFEGAKDLGLASAIAVSLFLMTVICSTVIFAVMKDRSDERWLKKQLKLQKAGGVGNG